MMATAPPKDPDKPWRWGESKVPGIVVHTEENDGATTFPAPLRLDLGKTSAAPPLRKSPVTVQEWIDSLPHPETEKEPSRTEETDVPVSETPETNDTFVLGAEAVHLAQTRPPSIVVDGPPVTMSPRENGLQEEQHPTRREQFSRARTTERMASFASDSAASNASSGGSHHSVESFLESRKLDPERILLNLGFGGSHDSSGELGLSRIPQRFLQPSQVKGISIADFYRHEMNMAQTFETGFYGYRGLTGPSHSTPSPIVAKIMERLKNRDRDYDAHSVVSAPTTTMEDPPGSPGVVPSSPGPFSSTPQQRFAAAAQRVQQSRSVLTRIQSWKSMQQDSTGGSVLNPDNRAFLQNQAQSKSPDVPRRKIIMGLRSYTFSGDGDLIECKQDSDKESGSKKDESAESTTESPATPAVKRPPPLIHKDSVLSSNTSFSEESDESDDEFRFRQLPKRECPDTPESYVATPTKLKHNRQSSFNKRMSSTSVSSWESDNWIPSPPVSGKSYHTFSSIDETCEDSTELSDVNKSKDSPTSGVFSLDNCDPNLVDVSATVKKSKDKSVVFALDNCDPSVVIGMSESSAYRIDRSVSDSDITPSNVTSSDLDHRIGSAPTSMRSITQSNVTSSDYSAPVATSQDLASRRESSASECNDANLVVSASLSSRRGSLKRQSRVSSVDEENWRAETELLKSTDASTSQPAEMAGIAEEPSERGLSRAGSAQSDSSGFQEGEAGASSAAPAVVLAEELPAAVSPSQAARIEQLQREMAQVATGLETFRAEILTENDPDAQARIQAKVDQISGVLLHLKSLCESLQQPAEQP